MSIAEKIWLRVFVDFAHDVAAGVFPGAVLAAWVIRSRAEAAGSGEAAVAQAAGGLWLIMFLGLLVSVVTGLIRLRYWKLNVRSGFLETKSTMAVVKHSSFVLMLLISSAALWTIVNR